MELITNADSANDRAYRWTKERIIDGSFDGGTLISEGGVAEALDISRTPVREAFLRLSAEGFLRLYPKRGALVVPVTEREIREVIEARQVIESWATAQVANAGADAQLLARLRGFVADQDTARRLGRGRAFQRADRAFHEAIVFATGNEIITRWHESLRDRQLRHGTAALAGNRQRALRVVDDHRKIVELIERGESKGAGDLVARHLAATLRASLEIASRIEA
jgi:DNA-binding GntR family transcriptional regulator